MVDRAHDPRCALGAVPQHGVVAAPLGKACAHVDEGHPVPLVIHSKAHVVNSMLRVPAIGARIEQDGGAAARDVLLPARGHALARGNAPHVWNGLSAGTAALPERPCPLD